MSPSWKLPHKIVIPELLAPLSYLRSMVILNDESLAFKLDCRLVRSERGVRVVKRHRGTRHVGDKGPDIIFNIEQIK